MNVEELKIFNDRLNQIKIEFNKFNGNDDIGKITTYINTYFNKFDQLNIDELDEFSLKLKSLKLSIKKMDLSKQILSELNELIIKLIELNNDLIMSMIISNL